MFPAVAAQIQGLPKQPSIPTAAPTEKPAGSKQIPQNPEATLDPTVGRLPQRFDGNDVNLFFNKLETGTRARSSDQAKGEFESTTQWKDRLRLSEESPLIGGLSSKGTYGFVVEQSPGDYPGVRTAYDADGLTFNITVRPEDYFRVTEDGLRKLYSAIPVLSKVSESSRLASNAFGVVREVRETLRTVYQLRFEAKAKVVAGALLPAVEISSLATRSSIPIPLNEARETKSNLRALAVCKLVPPFVSRRALTIMEATIESPFSVSHHYNYLSIDLLAIWVYNYETGVIYAKIDAKQ